VRLFVAIDPPAAAVADLDEALAAVRSIPLRWGNSDLWHVTLTFCGEVADAKVDELATRLERSARRAAPMTMRFAGAGAFPRPAHAGVLWIGLGGDGDELSRLAASTSAAARRCGLDVESRRYRPHLTVARSSKPTDLRTEVASLQSYAGPEWTATELHLVRSVLGPTTVHERLASWTLAT
jgi:RNA 2',3'-cyclic 3'-phosphodiesterase